MPQASIFRWRGGRGWLILSGGGAADSDDVVSIESRVLNHTVSQGPIAYVWAASDIEAADRHMDMLRDLGARTGYLVDILTEADDILAQQLSEAGVIILGDGSQLETLRDALVGAALRAIEEAYGRGATVYAVGASAALLGMKALERDHLLPGFNWLAHALVMPGYTPDGAQDLREGVYALSDPRGYGLGIGAGAAMAFGPDGELEAWGNRAITVTLGEGFDSGE